MVYNLKKGNSKRIKTTLHMRKIAVLNIGHGHVIKLLQRKQFLCNALIK